MSNGEVIHVHLTFKLISTVPRTPCTIDAVTGEPAAALHQRSDVTVVVSGTVVIEAMASLVITQALIKKTGGDCMGQMHESFTAYLTSIPKVRI